MKDKLKGKIHIGRCQSNMEPDFISIELQDDTSHCRAVSIKLSLVDFAKCITSQMVDCEFDWNNSGVIGKKREHKTIDITFPSLPYNRKDAEAIVMPIVKEYEKDGWMFDPYTVFESRNKTKRDYDKKTDTY